MMITPCQILTLIPVGCAGAVIAIALYETRQQAYPPAKTASTIDAADTQTAKWMQWHQEASAEAKTQMEPEWNQEPSDTEMEPIDQPIAPASAEELAWIETGYNYAICDLVAMLEQLEGKDSAIAVMTTALKQMSHAQANDL